MSQSKPVQAKDLSTRTKLVFKVGRRTFEAWKGYDNRWYGHVEVSGRIKDDFNYASRGSMRRSILERIRALYPGVEFTK